MRSLLLLLLLAGAAQAQSPDCVAVPQGPPMDIDLWVNAGRRPGAPQGGYAGIGLNNVPSLGTTCQARPLPPSAGVLQGPVAPRGLLQGDGPRDVLHNRPTPRVVIEQVPPGR